MALLLVETTLKRLPDDDLGKSLEYDPPFYDGWAESTPDSLGRTRSWHRPYTVLDGEKIFLTCHYKAYWGNGNVATQGTYIDGQQQGFWQIYNQNGTIACRGFKVDGLWIGKRETYDENGRNVEFLTMDEYCERYPPHPPGRGPFAHTTILI